MQLEQKIDKEKPKKKLPGIGRVDFFVCFLVWAVVVTFARTNFNSNVPWLLANLFILVPACAARLKNIGSNTAWCWLCMVPIIGLIVVVRCIIRPAGYAASKKLRSASQD